MATLPIHFPLEPQGAVASYSFTDILTRTGYVALYTVGDTADSLSLCPFAVESAHYTTTDATESGDVAEKELDIDLEFKTPQTVRGNCYVLLTYYVVNANGVDVGTAFTKVRIYHYDGTTETEIGAQQTTTTVTRAAAGTSYYRDLVVLNLTRKHFKIGDKFRLNVELWGSIGTNCTIGIYHDGANRDITSTTYLGESTPTDLKVYVPFEVDL